MAVTVSKHKGQSSLNPKHQLSGLANAVVLVVEDDPGIRQLTRAILAKHVKNIIQAENGQIGVDMCRNHPDVNIVLMDIKMPVMSGLDATRLIKSFRCDLPVVVITAYSLPEDRKAAIDAGCDDFLVKPFKGKDLLEKICKYIT